MKTKHFLLASVLAAASASAMPLIRDANVTVSQAAPSEMITVSYLLENEPAVVTCTVMTNGVDESGAPAWLPMTLANQKSISGDVGLLVSQGQHAIKFRPSKAGTWPDGATADFRFVLKAWPVSAPPDYMVVDAMGAERTRYYATSNDVPGGVTSDLYKTRKIVMRRVHASGVEWISGEPVNASGEGGYAPRLLQIPVVLTNDYYIAIYEMTVQQASYAIDGAAEKSTVEEADMVSIGWSYNLMRGTSDGSWSGWPQDGHEVKPTSKFQAMRTRTGVQFDYPTQAQWEFACRAGTTTSLNNGRNLRGGMYSPESLDEICWYYGNTNDAPRGAAAQVVGLLKPNAWGIYDMHGNRWEFCLDWFEKYTSQELRVEPVGNEESHETYAGRVMRGGQYNNSAAVTASGHRQNTSPDAYLAIRLWAPCIAVE